MAEKAKTEKQRMTIEERKAWLDKQYAELEQIEQIGKDLEEETSSFDRRIKSYMTRSVEVGKKEEQATNSNGELLYTWVPAGKGYSIRGTAQRAKDEGATDIKPYYEPIYREDALTLNDLDSWTRKNVVSYARISQFLKNIDPADLPMSDLEKQAEKQAEEEQKTGGEA